MFRGKQKSHRNISLKHTYKPGMVAHTYIFQLLKRIRQEEYEFEVRIGYIERLYLKNYLLLPLGDPALVRSHLFCSGLTNQVASSSGSQRNLPWLLRGSLERQCLI